MVSGALHVEIHRTLTSLWLFPIGVVRCRCTDVLLGRARLGWNPHTSKLQQLSQQCLQVIQKLTVILDFLKMKFGVKIVYARLEFFFYITYMYAYANEFITIDLKIHSDGLCRLTLN